jgi:hypothetical protein
MADPQFELSALARVLPQSLVDKVLGKSGKTDERLRKLPRELTTWLVVGMGLQRSHSVQRVLRHIADAFPEAVTWGPNELPHATSISHARDRLGWEAVREIYRRLARLLTKEHEGELLWRGHFVFTLDGTTFRTADTPANDACFGRPATTRGGKSAFPQLKAVMLMGAWTHVVADVAFGPYRVNEQKLAEDLVARLRRGSLVLVDRAYYSFVWPFRFEQRGAHYVVRARKGKCVPKCKRIRQLGRGDWLCELQCGEYARRRCPDLPQSIQVRTITRKAKGLKSRTIVTNLLSPTDYPADEVFELYRDRWEAELGYREVKVQMVEKPVPFRSHRPDRVLQEAYGLVIAYNCTRALMARAAQVAGIRPTRLSFVECLDRIRVALVVRESEPKLVEALSRCVLPRRRTGRSSPRAVKIKLAKYPRKPIGRSPGKTSYQRQRAKQQLRAEQAAAS